MLSTAYAAKKPKTRRLFSPFSLPSVFLHVRVYRYMETIWVTLVHGEVHSNFWQLLQLRKEDVLLLESWLHRSQEWFTSPIIQNEVLEIVALTVLWKVVRKFSGQYFTIMVDKTTDITNTEQMVFCIWYVDHDLATHEQFIGMHSLDSTTSESITPTIEDILLSCLCNWLIAVANATMAPALCLVAEQEWQLLYVQRSHEHSTGVTTALCAKEPRALYSHCYGHALNLAIQDTVRGNSILGNTLDTVEEMTKLIKNLLSMTSFSIMWRTILRVTYLEYIS